MIRLQLFDVRAIPLDREFLHKSGDMELQNSNKLAQFPIQSGYKAFKR